MKIYVAAPYQRGPFVRDLHRRLTEMGHVPVSSWARDTDGGPDGLPSLTFERIQGHIRENDEDIESSDILIALVTPGLGKEMYCETALGRMLGKPVFWVGQEEWMPLSSYRQGSRRFESVAVLMEAMKELSGADGLVKVWSSMKAV